MAKKHNGNLDIYGVLTLGADISASQYTLPKYKGDDGDTVVFVNGEAVFTNVAPYIDIAQTSGGATLVANVNQILESIGGISGAVDTFTELLDTPKPPNIVHSHEGEIIIVNPSASTAAEKISYSGVTIDDIFSYVDAVSGSVQGLINQITPNIGSYVSTVNNISGGISILPGSGIEVSTLPNGQITISLYSAITISSFTGGSTNEIGSTVNSVSLVWTLSKTPTSQSLNNGIGAITVGTTNYNYVTPITGNTTFTLTVSDGTTTPTANTSVTFLPRAWWGTNANTSLSSAQILTLSNNTLTSTRSRSFTINGGGQYIYYAYPSSYGAATFTVNGLLSTAWTLTVVSHTNASGHTQNYNVYRTNTIQNGTGISIVVS